MNTVGLLLQFKVMPPNDTVPFIAGSYPSKCLTRIQSARKVVIDNR